MKTGKYISYDALVAALDNITIEDNKEYLEEAEMQCWSSVEYGGGNGSTARNIFMHGVRSTIAAFKAMIKEIDHQEDILEDTYHLVFQKYGAAIIPFKVKTNKPLPFTIVRCASMILKNPPTEIFVKDRWNLEGIGKKPYTSVEDVLIWINTR